MNHSRVRNLILPQINTDLHRLDMGPSRPVIALHIINAIVHKSVFVCVPKASVYITPECNPCTLTGAINDAVFNSFPLDSYDCCAFYINCDCSSHKQRRPSGHITFREHLFAERDILFSEAAVYIRGGISAVKPSIIDHSLRSGRFFCISRTTR